LELDMVATGQYMLARPENQFLTPKTEET